LWTVVKECIKEKWEVLLLASIILIGAFLRFYNLGVKSLWFDELAEVTISQTIIHDLSLPHLGFLQGIWWELSPPMDYVIVHFIQIFGDSEFIVRFPAAIFGILSIIVIYYLAKELLGNVEGLISALLLAVSSMAIWYSQEARVYSLFLLLSLISFLFLYRASRIGNNLYWILVTIANIALIYTHYFGFFVLFIQGVYVFLIVLPNNSDKSGVKRISLVNKNIKNLLLFIVSSQIVLISFLPW